MRQPGLRPWIILTLIFLLGAVTGSLLTIGFGPRFVPGPLGPQEMRNHWMMHLTHRLNLTPDQQAKIQPILSRAETQIQLVHRNDLDHISTIMKESNASIAAVLDPGQRVELEKMERDRERIFSHHLHGPGRGPDDFHGPAGEDHPPDAPPGPTGASSGLPPT